MKQKIVRVKNDSCATPFHEKIDNALSEMNSKGYKLVATRRIPQGKIVYDWDGTPYGDAETEEMLFEED